MRQAIRLPRVGPRARIWARCRVEQNPMNNPLHQDEAARVAEVLSYNIIGTPPEPDYDEIAEMAARVTACRGV